MEYRKRFAHTPSAALPQCHAPTLAERPDGALVCAWYAGAYERAKDVAIYGAVLALDAAGWSERVVFADTPGFSEGNPVLFLFPDGRLWLFYVTMFGDRWDTCQVKYTHSHDGGWTWEGTVLLSSEWGWMTGCKPSLQPDGAILLPLYEERGRAFVLRSDDGGRQWTQSNIITTEYGVIQPTLAALPDGRLLMYLRTCEAQGGTIWQSLSQDGGRIWSDPSRVVLPNPNARVDLVRLASGRLALAFNDTGQGRTPLTLALSEDEGASWPYRYDVEIDAGEYSYPALIQARDGMLQLAYTWRRTHIAHIACDEEWILHNARPL
ncbi:MAG TPA: sialidase family protein [Chthonomonadaceae bacterium]|nr:sialidase family protein [Chthonomonadaceae bacterium]